MVQEIRHITLNKYELIDALHAHARVSPDFMPAGTIAALEGVDNRSLSINVVTQSDDYELFADVKMRGNKLLLPIIRYCVENNIWLPAEGHKSIEISDDTVSLRIETDTDSDLMAINPLRWACDLKAVAG